MPWPSCARPNKPPKARAAGGAVARPGGASPSWRRPPVTLSVDGTTSLPPSWRASTARWPVPKRRWDSWPQHDSAIGQALGSRLAGGSTRSARPAHLPVGWMPTVTSSTAGHDRREARRPHPRQRPPRCRRPLTGLPRPPTWARRCDPVEHSVRPNSPLRRNDRQSPKRSERCCPENQSWVKHAYVPRDQGGAGAPRRDEVPAVRKPVQRCLCGGREGDLQAQGVELADEVAGATVLVDALVVVVRAEVGKAGCRVGEQVPDNDQDGTRNGD